MSSIMVVHHDTITLEEYRRYRGMVRPRSVHADSMRVDGRSLDERRAARYDCSDYTGRAVDL